MKNTFLGLLLGLALGGAAVWFLPWHPARSAAAPEEKPAEKKEAAFLRHRPNGQSFLQLDKATQDRIGLKTVSLQATRLSPEIKGYGRVLDPTPLTALVQESAQASATLEASTKELQRLKTLVQSQTTSQRALEATEATVKRDQLAVAAVSPRLQLGWGQTIASHHDLPALARALAARTAALVRVDLPLGESLTNPPIAGRLAALTAPEQPLAAQWLGPAPSADPQMQSQGFLFLQTTNPLPPGAAVVAWLTLRGEPQSGVTVPRAALLRHQGEVFVYRRTGDGSFSRQTLVLLRPTDSGWFVAQGLAPGDAIVVVGAQQLWSEEVKGQGGGE